jgi:hypothetical protein
MIISKFSIFEQGYIILGFDFMHIMKQDRQNNAVLTLQSILLFETDNNNSCFIIHVI